MSEQALETISVRLEQSDIADIKKYAAAVGKGHTIYLRDMVESRLSVLRQAEKLSEKARIMEKQLTARAKDRLQAELDSHAEGAGTITPMPKKSFFSRLFGG